MDVFDLFRELPVFFAVCAGVVGLCVGSFLNVVIYRLPAMMRQEWQEQCRLFNDDQFNDMISGDDVAGSNDNPNDTGSTNAEPAADEPIISLNKPRSACRSCGTQLRAIDNIPVISYLLLRGKCAHCSEPVSIRYPLVEIFTALLSVAVAWHFGFGLPALAGIVLTWMLVALSFIDIDEQLLPDSITLPGIWLGLFVNLYGVYCEIQSAVIGAIAGYLVLWVVYQGFLFFTGKKGMGYGDFKLLALLGAWLGWHMLPLTILLSALSGAIIGITLQLLRGQGRDVPIPFGPYLAVAGWISLMWGNTIVDKYLQFAGMS